MTPEDDLLTAARPLVVRAAAVLRDNPALAAEVAALARAFAAWATAVAEPPLPHADAAHVVAPVPEPLLPAAVPLAPIPPPPPAVVPAPPPVMTPRPSGPPEDIYKLAGSLTFAAPPPPPPPPAPTGGLPNVVAPNVIVRRCKLKGEAARLAARRAAGDADPLAENDLRDEAEGLPDCKLWMLSDHTDPRPADVWERLAGAYTVVGAAADLLAAWLQTGDAARSRHAPVVLPLAAESQSTLRTATADAHSGWIDSDQLHLFLHVKEATYRERVYVQRYMRQDDWAKPENWPDVLSRVAALTAEVRALGARGKNRSKALNNLAYKLKKLAATPEPDADEWRRVFELIAELVDDGLPPSSVELREPLLPLFDRLEEMEELPPAMERVLRELERYVETRPAPASAAPSAAQFSPEVAEVARHLAGTDVVLIGGQDRPDRRAALVAAFGLSGLEWVTTPEHTSPTFFEPYVARAGVRVVLLATRWSSHNYQNVKADCEAHGKLFVKLPAGYHPNQVAHQILGQVGQKLRAV